MTDVSAIDAAVDVPADVPVVLAVRPQPLGAFGLPAGYLLVPAGADTEAARKELVAGRMPSDWPATLTPHRLAFEGDVDGALAALTGSDPVSVYNRFVLDPDGLDEAGLAELRVRLGEFGVLVDLVSYTLGRVDEPPKVGDSDAELAAVVLAAQAGHAVSTGDSPAALRQLDQAAHVASAHAPPLAAVLLASAAGIRRDVEGATDGVLAGLRRALDLLDGTDLRTSRADLHLTTALTMHELATTNPALLAEAVKHYQRALRLVESTESPQVWASAHANLAAAYLTMPMSEASDQLRLGIAVSSLRKALTIYTREDHPVEWASTQLNLANALVYAPSTHQGDNLVEAVELYEAVLAVRDRETDPVGRARVLANQGNVLAHLGMFDHAKAKLYEARYLFDELGDGESVRAVRGVLDEVARQTALARTEAE